MSDSHRSDSPTSSYDSDAAGHSDQATRSEYRVLARKYRPKTFDTLIGQPSFVRTLTNSLNLHRLAQAYLLTGIRGVGKTTSARIMARAFNCIGADGKGEPTPFPCGVCSSCLAIDESRHVDVIEVDAASHTGIADVRELIDGISYYPVLARFKIYIIDEVHMLSEKAFNALLKTLEEPPSHVKFILATTEVRKVPVTVLSRCQRFDLRRVESDQLSHYFANICTQEQIPADPTALSLIARAAEGSVRDGLSLLDQAMVLGIDRVTVDLVIEMLGLKDRTRLLDVLTASLRGEVKEALNIVGDLFDYGADPIQMLRDLLEMTHILTRLSITPEDVDPRSLSQAHLEQGKILAQRLSIADLTRAWQILLTGLKEAQQAPIAEQAVEMVIIRLAYAASLPLPVEIIRQWQKTQDHATPSVASSPALSHPVPEQKPQPQKHTNKNDLHFVPANENKDTNTPKDEKITSFPSDQTEVNCQNRLDKISDHPVIKTILDVFPGARIVDPHGIPPQESHLDQTTNDDTMLKTEKNLSNIVIRRTNTDEKS